MQIACRAHTRAAATETQRGEIHESFRARVSDNRRSAFAKEIATAGCFPCVWDRLWLHVKIRSTKFPATDKTASAPGSSPDSRLLIIEKILSLGRAARSILPVALRAFRERSGAA